MNVETGAEAAQFPGKEYIIGIAVAVCVFMVAINEEEEWGCEGCTLYKLTLPLTLLVATFL
jgi:hypothetical protein